MYWQLQILSDLASYVGVSLRFDANAIEGELVNRLRLWGFCQTGIWVIRLWQQLWI